MYTAHTHTQTHVHKHTYGKEREKQQPTIFKSIWRQLWCSISSLPLANVPKQLQSSIFIWTRNCSRFWCGTSKIIYFRKLIQFRFAFKFLFFPFFLLGSSALFFIAWTDEVCLLKNSNTIYVGNTCTVHKRGGRMQIYVQ